MLLPPRSACTFGTTEGFGSPMHRTHSGARTPAWGMDVKCITNYADSMHEVAPPYLPSPYPPPYPPPLPPPPTFGSLRSTDGSLRSTRGPAPAPPLNNMTPAVAIDRLLCVLPCVCTAFCVYCLACGPLNNMTPAVATDRLLCVPPCVCTAFCVHRLACGPLNNMTPAVATDRLLCVPPSVCTALCVHRLLCAPPCLWPLK